MVYIGIDPSLDSTAISIFKDDCFWLYNYTNKKSSYKWIKTIDSMVNFQHHKYEFSDEYSESEIEKLKIYDQVTTSVVEDIIGIVGCEPTHVFIEGYSYSSAQGRLIDLVTFSTLIRVKLLKHNIKISVIPPSSLKKAIAEAVYVIDKKGVARNESGKAGGSFDKKDMYECLIKMDFDFSYMEFLRQNKTALLSPKNIPKPFDDINDALLLCIYGINQK